MRKVAAALGGSLAVSCHTTLAPQAIPILLTGFKAECPRLLEGHHLGDQYDLPELPVDGLGRPERLPRPVLQPAAKSGWFRSLGPMAQAPTPSVTV
jgi:hypothetical protein